MNIAVVILVTHIYGHDKLYKLYKLYNILYII